MNNEVESYVGELRELRKLVSIIKDNQDFIQQRITWLDSDIRMGNKSDWEKQNMREMRDFLLSLVDKKRTEKIRVSGVPYEVNMNE